MQLSSDIPGANGLSISSKKYSEVPESDKKYAYKYDKDFGKCYIVTHAATRYLIDHALIPLDLQWSVSFNGEISVSWDHWPKK